MDSTNLQQPDLYFKRELSLLQFQQRVLAQASDESVPGLAGALRRTRHPA